MRAKSRHSSPKPKPPLGQESLEALAVFYVERYQTSRARLLRYLAGKVQQRGWGEDTEPDLEAIANRLAGLGYVDDRAFAEARVRSLQRRGLGASRIRQALGQYGIASDLTGEALAELSPQRAALDFARRRRFGPFGPPPADPRRQQKQFAAMLRAGHSPGLVRAILEAESINDAEALDTSED